MHRARKIAKSRGLSRTEVTSVLFFPWCTASCKTFRFYGYKYVTIGTETVANFSSCLLRLVKSLFESKMKVNCLKIGPEGMDKEF